MRRIAIVIIGLLIISLCLPIILAHAENIELQEKDQIVIEEDIDPSEWFVEDPFIQEEQEAIEVVDPPLEIIKPTNSTLPTVPEVEESFDEIEWYSEYRPATRGVPITEIYGELVNREFLVKLVFAESGGESWLCQVYTCSAIINHCEVEKVSLWTAGHDRGHFSVAPYVDTVEPTELTYAVVDYVLNGGLIEDICYFRTRHYHNFGTPVCRLGGNYFSME